MRDRRHRSALPGWHIPVVFVVLLLTAYSVWSSVARPAWPSAGALATQPAPRPSTAPTPAASSVVAERRASPSLTPTPTLSDPSPTFAGATATATLLPELMREELFIDVWRTVRDNYLYQDYRGVDWEALRATYQLRASAARSSSEFYELLSQMVGELKDEHSRYLAPWQAAEEDALTRGTDGYVGIGILSERDSDGILVHYVFSESPAEEAGIRRRDRIIAVNGIPYTDGMDIRGPEGTAVLLTIRSPGQPPREVSVERRSILTKFRAVSSRLDLDPAIGYILIPSLWADDMDDQVQGRLGGLLAEGPLSGLIIDLRGNGGGWRPVLEGVLGQFVSGEVGTFYTRQKSYPLAIAPGELYDNLEQVALVVLIDSATESYAEVLAAALQQTGRARVVGVASAGNTETIYGYNFDDKSRLWVAQEGFMLPNGTDLEGRGVVPDALVDEDWTRYPAARDPYILAALDLLRR